MKALTDFPVTIELAVHWGDMDALGHVNNANYFRYIEASRLRYLETVGLDLHPPEQKVVAVLSRVACDFIVPLHYPDLLTVGTRSGEVGRDFIAMEHFLASRQKGLIALGESVLALVDPSTGKKRDIPDAMKEAIARLEKTAP
jgi:acyl-CoA thioester hydrolase